MKFRDFILPQGKWKEKIALERLMHNASQLESFYLERGFKIPVRTLSENLLKDSKVVFKASSRERAGSFEVISGKLYIPDGTSLTDDYVRTHELTHATSRRLVVMDHQDGGSAGRAVVHIGFGFTDALQHRNHGQTARLFSALNEAMTSEITARVMTKKISRLAIFFEGRNTGRKREIDLLRFIMRNIASTGVGSEEDVFNQFLDSFLHGWTPSLKKDLRNAFGQDVLKILAIVDTYQGASSERRSLRNSFVWDNVYVYFDLSYPPDVRKRAAQRLLIAFDPKHHAEETRDVRMNVARQRRLDSVKREPEAGP